MEGMSAIDARLVKAAENGSVSGIRTAIQNGADIHVYDDWPIQLAAEYRHKSATEYLLSLYDDEQYEKLMSTDRASYLSKHLLYLSKDLFEERSRQVKTNHLKGPIMSNKIVTVLHGTDDDDQSYDVTVALIKDGKVTVMDTDKNEVSIEIAKALDPSIKKYAFNERNLPPNWGGKELAVLVVRHDIIAEGKYANNLKEFFAHDSNSDYIHTENDTVIAVRDDHVAIYDTIYDAMISRDATAIISHDNKAVLDAKPRFNQLASVKMEGSELIMTLLNGETVSYTDNTINANSELSMGM